MRRTADMANGEGRWRRFRPRWPTTALGWVMWLLVALLFYFLISIVLLPWWHQPVPTTPPPVPPNSNTGRI